MIILEALTLTKICNYLEEINDKLAELNLKGEITIAGGAAMLIIFGERPDRKFTNDVDAVYVPEEIIDTMVDEIAEKYKLRFDWLNKQVKPYLPSNLPRKTYLSLSNLFVNCVDKEGLLAMKLFSARPKEDKDDILFLAKELNISSADELIALANKYFEPDEYSPFAEKFIRQLFSDSHKDSVT